MAFEASAVRTNAGVEATDGRLGAVDHVVARPDSGEVAYLVVRRGWTNELLHVPGDAVREVAPNGTIHLTVSKEQARQMAASVPQDALLATQDGSTVRVPLLEEELVPEKRLVDLGELRIHKLVDVTEEVVREAVTRDDLLVERTPVNQPLEAPIGSRVEDDWLVIPIMEEVLVVQKQLMLKEEIRIKKRQVVEEQEVQETVRHERAEVEDATVHGVRNARGERTAPGALDGQPASARSNPTLAAREDLRSAPGRGGAGPGDTTVPVHTESHSPAGRSSDPVKPRGDAPSGVMEERHAPADDVTRPIRLDAFEQPVTPGGVIPTTPGPGTLGTVSTRGTAGTPGTYGSPGRESDQRGVVASPELLGALKQQSGQGDSVTDLP